MTADPQKKVKQEQLIVAALLVVFVGLFLNSLRSMGVLGGKRASTATRAVPAAVHPDMQAKGSKGREAPSSQTPVNPPLPLGDVTYTAQTLRDPFQSLLPKKPVTDVFGQSVTQTASLSPKASVMPPELAVQGLWWQGAQAKAMIQGDLYDVGDTVEGVKITRITREGVDGEFEGAPVHFAVAIRESSNKSVVQSRQRR